MKEHPYLKLSGCTKISPVVATTPKGKKVTQLKNSFGLPAGTSCPGMTEFCSGVCYAGNLEKLRPQVRALLESNWNALKDADISASHLLLEGLIADFRYETLKSARKYRLNTDELLKFRIHWDGDFFSADYARAWGYVIESNPDIQFWAYTRSFDGHSNEIVGSLLTRPLNNLALWLSVDEDNVMAAQATKAMYPQVRLAFLANTFEDSKVLAMGTQRPGVKCPAETGRLPIVNDKGEGACIQCNMCLDSSVNNNVRFSTTRK